MYELTDEWLEKINEEFKREDVPHKQRPWRARSAWAKHTGLPVSLGDEVVTKIFAWFEENTKAGSQYTGYMYTGALYYDSCFWPVLIPVVFGEVWLKARDALKTMPPPILARLCGDRNDAAQYTSLFAACLDYGFGIEELSKDKAVGGFTRELLTSGDQQLNAAVTLLLEDRPNSKAMESARMAAEMFLKAFLAAKAGLTDVDARKRIGHNLETALNECLAVDAKSELQAVRPDLQRFPDVGDRYKGTERAPSELWVAYSAAQFIATTVVRALTGRDSRQTMA